MNQSYPADIFTACLTSPIMMALRWFLDCNEDQGEGTNKEQEQ